MLFTKLATSSAYRGIWRAGLSPTRPSVAFFASVASPPSAGSDYNKNDDRRSYLGASPLIPTNLSSPAIHGGLMSLAIQSSTLFPSNKQAQQTIARTILSTSSFSSLPPDEEQAEKARVDSLTSYQREMELRQLDTDIARLETLRAINNGELYTLRGKFKMLSRNYGMGFLAWYWTVWFSTAGLSYLAMELGGVDPMMVASKIEMWMGWEATTITGRLDPTLGEIGLVVAANECLEPIRLPFVVVTTKPVVNFFTKR